MTEEIISYVNDESEYDSIYSEVEFLLDEYDNENNPVNISNDLKKINWMYIKKKTEFLLIQCFDFRIALWNMRANFHIEGFSALYSALIKIDAKLSANENAVEDVSEHPRESYYPADLSWLATLSCFREIKNIKLYPSSDFTVSELSDINVNEDNNINSFKFVSVVEKTNIFFSENGLAPFKEQVEISLKILERIESYADSSVHGFNLNCYKLRGLLKHILRFITDCVVSQGGDEQQKELSGFLSERKIDVKDNEAKKISSRQDVILMLEKILDYFNKYEPSHPAPILIRRSQKMVGMGFAEIVEELLPDSLSDLNKLSGS
ncbi:TPA: ImpA family type VI secretion system protein [Serratia liquefaciens]